VVRANPRRTQPFVSVILPTIGRAELRQAVQSLVKSDYAAFEVLIVYDPERRGSTVARNVGLMLAQGNFVHFAEDDCIYEVGTLHALMQKYQQTIAQDSNCAGIVGCFKPPVWGGIAVRINITVSPEGLRITPILGEGSTDYLATGNTLCSKQAILQCGGFNERYAHMFEDLELSLVLKHEGMKLYNCRAAVAEHLNAPRLESQVPLKRSPYLRVRNSILLHRTWCGNPVWYTIRQASSNLHRSFSNRTSMMSEQGPDRSAERRRAIDIVSYGFGAIAGLTSGTARKGIKAA